MDAILIPLAAISLMLVATLGLGTQQSAAMWLALAALAILGAGLGAVEGLEWLDPQGRGDAVALLVIGGAALTLPALLVLARARWYPRLKVAILVASIVFLGWMFTLLALAARPEWRSLEEPPPGAPGSPSTAGDVAWDVARVGAPVAALVLAALMPIAGATSRRARRA